MKESEALEQVARLFSAYPSSKADASNARAYGEQLVILMYPLALRDSVDCLIRTERWLPSIAAILDEYSRHRGKYVPRALLPPDLSEEDQTRNIRRVRALSTHLASSDHGDTFEACQDSECTWARGAKR